MTKDLSKQASLKIKSVRLLADHFQKTFRNGLEISIVADLKDSALAEVIEYIEVFPTCNPQILHERISAFTGRDYYSIENGPASYRLFLQTMKEFVLCNPEEIEEFEAENAENAAVVEAVNLVTSELGENHPFAIAYVKLGQIGANLSDEVQSQIIQIVHMIGEELPFAVLDTNYFKMLLDKVAKDGGISAEEKGQLETAVEGLQSSAEEKSEMETSDANTEIIVPETPVEGPVLETSDEKPEISEQPQADAVTEEAPATEAPAPAVEAPPVPAKPKAAAQPKKGK